MRRSGRDEDDEEEGMRRRRSNEVKKGKEEEEEKERRPYRLRAPPKPLESRVLKVEEGEGEW